MKKVLIYNWVQFDNKAKMGGGVTVYCKNIVDYYKNIDDISVYFLSSGMAYDSVDKALRIEETDNIYAKDGVKSFEVVNSPILSPGFAQFHELKTYTDDTALYEEFCKFVEMNGPFDVIHFNNLEGLTTRILEIKKDYPNTKTIFSVHNYYPFCPQVNLWWCEQKNCKDYRNGSECLGCVGWVNTDYEREIKSFVYDYKKKNRKISEERYIYFRRVKRKILQLIKTGSLHTELITRHVPPEEFRNYREENVKAINSYIDIVLGVSERVSEITKSMGVNPQKVFTSYIGSKFADNVKAPHSISGSEKLNIIYLGYQRKDKGFFFLLDCLRSMPDEEIKKIVVTFAVKTDDSWVLNEWEKLRERGLEIIHKNGYTHDEFEELMNRQDLCIVPVLWEDNLPQVAIEAATSGVPVLASDLGGANELSKSDKFIFQNGDIIDFRTKLMNIVNNRDIINDYWEKFKGVPTMSEHIEELNRYYFD